MKLKTLALIAILCGLGVLLYFFLPGEDHHAEPVQPIIFTKTIKIVTPPQEFLRKGVANRVERLLDRLIWGTNEAVNRTIGMLVQLNSPAVITLATVRLRKYLRDRPSLAKDYVDLLAETKDPAVIPVLVECAGDSTEMIRKAAIRGLIGLDYRQTGRILIEQAQSGEPRMRLFGLQNLIPDRSPETFVFLSGIVEQESDLELRTLAIEHLGHYDSELSRELLHRCFQDSRLDVRTAALKALLTLGDEQGNLYLEEMLGSEGPIRRINGVQLMKLARSLPALSRIEALASDPVDEVRILLTIALITHLEAGGADNLDRARAGLQLLLGDPRPDVRIKALEGLYKCGDESVALSYLSKLPQAHGAELAEAVELTTKVFRCATAAQLLLDRFENDPGLTADERLTLLNGLANLKEPRAVDLFFRTIAGEGDSRGASIGEFTLDRHAALIVHRLGEGVLERWQRFIDESHGDTAAYLYVNGVRNLGDARAAESLFEMAMDTSRSRWIREEAIKSMASFQDLQAGEYLLELHRDCPDRELGRLAYMVFWNYF